MFEVNHFKCNKNFDNRLIYVLINIMHGTHHHIVSTILLIFKAIKMIEYITLLFNLYL